jgi:hypothetical protein
MFHKWMSTDGDACSCLECGLTVADGYLFREDPERKLVIGISVSLPNCPGVIDEESHYFDAEGNCHWCGADSEETDTVVCIRPE